MKKQMRQRPKKLIQIAPEVLKEELSRLKHVAAEKKPKRKLNVGKMTADELETVIENLDKLITKSMASRHTSLESLKSLIRSPDNLKKNVDKEVLKILESSNEQANKQNSEVKIASKAINKKRKNFLRNSQCLIEMHTTLQDARFRQQI